MIQSSKLYSRSMLQRGKSLLTMQIKSSKNGNELKQYVQNSSYLLILWQLSCFIITEFVKCKRIHTLYPVFHYTKLSNVHTLKWSSWYRFIKLGYLYLYFSPEQILMCTDICIWRRYQYRRLYSVGWLGSWSMTNWKWPRKSGSGLTKEMYRIVTRGADKPIIPLSRTATVPAKNRTWNRPNDGQQHYYAAEVFDKMSKKKKKKLLQYFQSARDFLISVCLLP
jgi:hypothetical protein